MNNAEVYKEVKKYVSLIAPERESIVKLYKGDVPIFDNFSVTKQIKSGLGKAVSYKRGAYLVIEHTEALHVVDVNSGNRSRGVDGQEANAFEVNMGAAEELARQLRLRDMGGIIVVDFIDRDEDIIRSCISNFSDRSTRDALAGVLPGVLTDIVLKRINVRKLVSDNDIDKFIKELHEFTINISGTNGLDNAQVTRGGLKLSSLDEDLQSRLIIGLYVCGEVINVDGPCGGYNLQWAWSSSVVVADKLSRSIL